MTGHSMDLVALASQLGYSMLYAGRWLPEGSLAIVTPLTFGRARLCVGDTDSIRASY